MRILYTASVLCFLASLLASCAGTGSADVTTENEPSWRPLFDGRTLAGWEICSFGGEGEVSAESGELHLHPGVTLTGVRWAGPLDELLAESRDRYEIRLRARRVDGTDFFCGLTFPVGPGGRLTLILGGWGGSLIGLSCLDGDDASENETTTFRKFESDRWYRVRVRVSAAAIECWIDDERVVATQRADHESLTLRAEVIPTDPLGLSTFQTHGVFRDIELRRLDE